MDPQHPLRFVVVKRPALLKRLEYRLVRAVSRWQRQAARRLARRAQDFAAVEVPWPDDEYEASQRDAMQSRLGLALPPSLRRRCVAVGMRFSLHADTAVHGHDR